MQSIFHNALEQDDEYEEYDEEDVDEEDIDEEDIHKEDVDKEDIDEEDDEEDVYEYAFKEKLKEMRNGATKIIFDWKIKNIGAKEAKAIAGALEKNSALTSLSYVFDLVDLPGYRGG